ncbi:MAG TPA: alpha/beta fold hydrolase [Chloroflexota bacterium]
MHASVSHAPHSQKGWLLSPPREMPSALRLYCFPYAGAGVSAYMAWSIRVPAWLEVRGVQLPGRENRFSAPAVRRIDTLVSEASDAIAGSLDPPYAMFGCSLGALLAFELASLWCQRGYPQPTHLFVASCAAPPLLRNLASLSKLDDLSLLSVLEQRYGTFGTEALHEPELRAIMLPTLRADLEAIETYQYHSRPLLECPITAVIGRDDRGLTRADVERWGELTSGSFTVQPVPGGHFLPRESPAEVTQAIMQRLMPLHPPPAVPVPPRD